MNVTEGSVWRHRNGAEYRVLFLTNEFTKNNNKYPVTVVYENTDNHKRWSRPLNDWHRSMTRVGG